MKRKIATIITLAFLTLFNLKDIKLNVNATDPEYVDSGLNYTESTDAIINPDRGFYKGVEGQLNPSSSEPFATRSSIENYASQYGILHLRIGLEKFSANAGYTDQDITAEAKASLSTVLSYIRDTNASAIIRFSYNYKGLTYTSGGKTYYYDYEPSMDLIKTHIASLCDVINENFDVICGVESGMIGPWGEQHGTTLAKSGAHTFYELVDTWLDNLNEGRTITVRQPLYWRNWANEEYGISLTENNMGDFDLSTLDATNTRYKRVGIFNDGYLGSSSDRGTFKNREQEVAFISKIAKTTLYGGEVAKDSGDGVIGDYNSVSYMTSESFTTHTSYLNIGWNGQVIDAWKNTAYAGSDTLYTSASKTGFEYIENHLGYRLLLTDLQTTNGIHSDGKYYLKGTLKNVGFGNVINRKNVNVVLYNNEHTYSYPIDIDVRNVLSNSTLDFDTSFTVGAIEEGLYNVGLQIKDYYEDNNSNHRSIRLANQGMVYNDTLGVNKYGEVTISAIPAEISEFTGSSSGYTVTNNPSVDEENDLPDGLVKVSYTDGTGKCATATITGLESDTYTKMDMQLQSSAKTAGNYNDVMVCAYAQSSSSGSAQCLYWGSSSAAGGTIKITKTLDSLGKGEITPEFTFMLYLDHSGVGARSNTVVLKYLRFYNDDGSKSVSFGIPFISTNDPGQWKNSSSSTYTIENYPTYDNVNGLDGGLVKLSYTDETVNEHFYTKTKFSALPASDKIVIEYQSLEENQNVNFGVYFDYSTWYSGVSMVDYPAGRGTVEFNLSSDAQNAVQHDFNLIMYLDRDGYAGNNRSNTVVIKSITFFNGASITKRFSTQVINYHNVEDVDISSYKKRYVPEIGYTLPSPTKSGYTFMGWYTEDTFDNRITRIEAGSTDDVELYAKWVRTELNDFSNLQTKFSLGLNYTYDDPNYTLEGVKMRFGVTMSEELYTSLDTLGATFGVELTKGSKVVEASATIIARVDAQGVADVDGDYYQYSVVLTGVPQASYSDEITARCYVEYDSNKYYCASKEYSVSSAAQAYLLLGGDIVTNYGGILNHIINLTRPQDID